MTLYEFNALNDDEKANAAWAGSFLADRAEQELTVQLYAVSSFYVEVFYDSQENRIVGFRSFNTKNLLVPYLAHIKFNIQ